MKNSIRTFALLVLSTAVLNVWAYGIDTHDSITQNAIANSVLGNDPTILARLGLRPSSDKAQLFPNSKGSFQDIVALFVTGVRVEDDFPRSLHHFFNPETNEPLNVRGLAAGNTSPDWALEDKREIGGTIALDGQEFSYRDARLYLYRALTQSKKTERDRHFGLTFESLGHVIHHIQDMAQPQHVRNDQHLELETPSETRLCLASLLLCGNYLSIKNPSLCESYTDRVRETLPFDGYPAVYSEGDRDTFNSPRKFWQTTNLYPQLGKGLAEFTSQNFVSTGTNFRRVNVDVMPHYKDQYDMDIQNLLPGTPLRGKMSFVRTDVKDNLTGQTTVNPMASSFSIFDPDLKAAGRTPTYTINRFNLDLQHAFLMPRAVGYSAGMINYFFRGSIDMVKDKDAVSGYLIRNLGAEPMSGRFALYYDAKGGERKPVMDAATGKPLVWFTDEWGGTLAPQSDLRVLARFETPADAETPEEYILVFDGDMGEEKASSSNVGAVTAKVIKAPGSKLYLVGFDTRGRKMYMKADGAGVRIIDGWDANEKQIKTGESSPIFDAFKNHTNPAGLSPWNKQVTFENGLRGIQYRVEAASGMGYVFSTDPKNQRWVTKTPGLGGWIARPANEPGVEYEFDLRGDGHLLYTRRCAGYGSRSCESYRELPWPADVSQDIVDTRVAGAISADGTLVCGLPAVVGIQGTDVPGMGPSSLTYPIKWNGSATGQLVCLSFTFAKGVVTMSKKLLTTFGTSSAASESSYYEAVPHERNGTASTTGVAHSGAIIGYIEGKLYFKRHDYQATLTSSVVEFVNQPGTQNSSAEYTFPEGRMGVIGSCRLAVNATMAFGADPAGIGGIGQKGTRPSYAFTHRAQDAIYHVVDEGCDLNDPYVAPVAKFRNIVIDDGNFVIDSSPNGEMFFARGDLSVIIHEPKPYGVKPIDRGSLPSNLSRLIGVLWL